MFDYVEFEGECEKCGAEIEEFQSKDGPCLLERLTPKEVRFFYKTCPKCKHWNEYRVVVEAYHVERVHDAEKAEVINLGLGEKEESDESSGI